MAAILVPRLDTASKQKPNGCAMLESDREWAKADGLTEVEALELSHWLRQSGYAWVKLIRHADRCSVQWQN